MKKILKNKLLWIIVIIFIISRLSVLIENQNIYAEERRLGLISKHIVEKDDYSVFDYGHAFEGSIVLESYLAAPFIYFFGMSRTTVRLVPFIFSLILIIIFFLFLEKNFNKKVAVISSLLYIFSPFYFIRLNVLEDFGRFIGMFFSFVMIFFFYQIFFNKKTTKPNFILFGIFSGLGVWAYPTPMITLLVSFIFWFAFDKKFFLKNNFFIFLISFIIGFLPRIYYKMTWHPQSINIIEYFIYRDVISNLNNFIPAAKRLFTKLIPISLSLSDSEQLEHLFLAYGYYFIALMAFIVLFYLNRKPILTLLKGLIPSKKFDIKPEKISKETFILIYPVVFLAIFSFMTGAISSAAHRLVEIQPFIFIAISIFAVWLWDKRFKVFSLSIILFLLSTGVYGNLILIRSEQRLDTTESINNLISFLDNKNIKYVYSHSLISPDLIYASNEKIIAYEESFDDIDPDFRYPKYNELVDNATNYAFVYFKNSSTNKILKSYLDAFNISSQKKIIDNKVVYYSLSKNIRPKNFSVIYIFYENSVGDRVFKNQLNYNNIAYERNAFDDNKVIYFLSRFLAITN